jgi:hypothetical protein
MWPCAAAGLVPVDEVAVDEVADPTVQLATGGTQQ